RGAGAALPGLPGTRIRPPEEAIRLAGEVQADGIPAVAIFGSGSSRDDLGSASYDPRGPVAQTIRGIKRLWPELIVLADTCVCGYSRHGTCGVASSGRLDPQRTLRSLERAALVQAAAGADLVMPSSAVDHQVARVRAALDERGFDEVGVVGASTQLTSALDAPYRHAAEIGERQRARPSENRLLDARNGREVERQLEQDALGGADLLMIRPALPCLDLIAQARGRFGLPIIAFQVSGELAVLRAAGAQGLIDERSAVRESLVSIRRAGADLIVTFAAREVAWTPGDPSA
ncbi:MAG: porphobilinogen synthase, partial [Thermoplasmata archaeon]|nr:porphobilinogen synthase [Thermoplasmata archaeon]